MSLQSLHRFLSRLCCFISPALPAEEVEWGGGAHREWCGVGELAGRGDRELWSLEGVLSPLSR